MKILIQLILTVLIFTACSEKTINSPKIYCHTDKNICFKWDTVTTYINLHWFNEIPKINLEEQKNLKFTDIQLLDIQSSKEILILKHLADKTGKHSIKGNLEYEGKSYPFSTFFNVEEPFSVISVAKANKLILNQFNTILISSSIYPSEEISVIAKEVPVTDEESSWRPISTDVEIKKVTDNNNHFEYSVKPTKKGVFELYVKHKKSGNILGAKELICE